MVLPEYRATSFATLLRTTKIWQFVLCFCCGLNVFYAQENGVQKAPLLVPNPSMPKPIETKTQVLIHVAALALTYLISPSFTDAQKPSPD